MKTYRKQVRLVLVDIMTPPQFKPSPDITAVDWVEEDRLEELQEYGRKRREKWFYFKQYIEERFVDSNTPLSQVDFQVELTPEEAEEIERDRKCREWH